MKNNKPSQNKDESKNIKSIGLEIIDKISEDFSRDTGIVPPSTLNENKKPDEFTKEEVKYFKEKDKYINEHKYKYIKLYEDELKHNFEVKFL